MRKLVLITIVILTLILSSCLAKTPPDNNVNEDASDNAPRVNKQVEGIAFGDNLDWPEYIPSDIPPIMGDIKTIMADEFNIRIFFEGVSESNLETYLADLKKEGFELEYIVYVQEGFADNSEELLNNGEYDAVNITKGDYRMRIEYGEGQGTYDIDPRGFSVGIEINTSPAWPKELVGIVPQPEDSLIESIMPSAECDYSIVCRATYDTYAIDYINELLSLGYQASKKDYNQNGQLVDITLTLDDTIIYVRSYSDTKIGIEVSLNKGNSDQANTNTSSVDNNWPSDISKDIPPFTKGVIENVLSLSEGGTMLTITVSSTDAVSKYQELLVSNGYTLNNEDHYVKGEWQITLQELMNSDMITIRIEEVN